MLRFGPGLNRPLLKSQTGIGNHQVEIQTNSVSKALTGRTGSIGIIETEESRLRRGVNSSVIFAFKPFRETQPFWFRSGRLDQCCSMSFLKTDLQRINQPLAYVGPGS